MSLIQVCTGGNALGYVSGLMLQKDSSGAKKSPSKEGSPGGFSLSMRDSQISAIAVDF